MNPTTRCDLCNKMATVHLTQILNGQVKKVDLCEQCAKKNGITDPEGFSLMDLLSNGLFQSNLPPQDVQTCPQCRYSLKNFKKSGRLGCPSCYEAFEEVLTPMIESLHIGTHHQGKVPAYAQGIANSLQLDTLRGELQQAIGAEDFERAAILRDRIRQLESESKASEA